MVLPGPEAQQLAAYIGWLMHRTWVGIAACALTYVDVLSFRAGMRRGKAVK